MRRRFLFKLLNNCTVPSETLALLAAVLFPRPLLSVTTTSHIAICCNLSPPASPDLPLLCFQLTPPSLPPSPCLLASVRPLYLWAIIVIHCYGTNHLHAGLPLPHPHPFFPALSLPLAPLPSSLSCGCLPSPTAGHCYTVLPRLCLISHRMAAWHEWRGVERK